MALILWLIMALVPLILGKGTLAIIYGTPKRKKLNRTDEYLTGLMIGIGIGEAAHLAAVFLKWSFSGYVKVAVILTGCACVLAGIIWFLRGREQKKRKRHKSRLAAGTVLYKVWGKERTVFLLFGLSVLLQIVVLVTGREFYRTGDATLETVNSFLVSDGIYQVNPMTGQAYTLGIPFRLEILSLPSLYGGLCRLSGLSANQVVLEVVPIVVLAAAYLTYERLGEALFGREKWKKGVFLLLVSVIFWLGDYVTVTDSFCLMHCGWQGTTIRTAILLPYTISLCIRERWKPVLLCILAEACIVWTLYGLGFCVLTVCLLLAVRYVLQRMLRMKKGKKEGAAWNS